MPRPERHSLPAKTAQNVSGRRTISKTTQPRLPPSVSPCTVARMRLSFLIRGIGRFGALTLVVALWVSSVARADDGGTDAGTAPQTDGGSETADGADPRTAQIRALLAGTLAVDIAPQSLFEVPLTNEPALEVEAVRLRTLLRVVDQAADAGTPGRVKVAPTAAAIASAHADIETLDPARWHAREALDRARLDFYSLSAKERASLLSAQDVRVQAAKPKETEEERRAREASEERERALAAARAARSEAERLVGKELARLIGVEQSVAQARDHFNDVRVELATRKDSLLGWQHRVSDAKLASSASADDTYEALRKTLRGSRDDLDHALDTLDATSSNVPDIGPDPLGYIPSDISVEHVRKRRAAIVKLIADARREERMLREERAAVLLSEIDSLNRARLGLLSYLSPEKRRAITGFTAAGFDQARSEGRQLLLILRYHRHVVLRWVGDFARRRGIAGVSGWDVAAVMVPWLLAVLAFLWLRLRSVKWLAVAEERLAKADRREQRTAPGALLRAVRFLSGFHRTLEWLLLFALTVWTLPVSARALLEVQLLEVILGWSLGGALIVNVVNAIATTASRSSDDVGSLRLRSLRLVGRVVVVFALVLLVSVRLVGEGTIYSWVSSTCWFAALPVFLILVRWWREIVFERVERARRKSALQAWVLANRRGWKSFFAAMIAAVHLFGVGSYKVIRNRVTRFNLARRAHAYLFKRELDRIAGEKTSVPLVELSRAAFASLAPDRSSAVWVECSAARELLAIHEQRVNGRGGIIAVVGARGSGKSSLLRRFAGQSGGALSVSLRGQNSFDQVRAAFGDGEASTNDPALVLLEDAQSLIKPLRGGLRAFDDALAFALERTQRTLWVFAIDAVLWPFLSRARDARPLFEEVITLAPWRDEQIGALLSERSAEAQIVPTFEDLLDKLPISADEIDRQEALAARRAGYFRMIWDYARGNPAIALEVWRASLSEDAAGVVRVRSLTAPDAGELEHLPDSALFILRAILQMDPATLEEVARATRLSDAHVQNTIRFGRNRGYIVEERGKLRVAWAWLRSVVLLLERRHLLVNP